MWVLWDATTSEICIFEDYSQNKRRILSSEQVSTLNHIWTRNLYDILTPTADLMLFKKVVIHKYDCVYMYLYL